VTVWPVFSGERSMQAVSAAGGRGDHLTKEFTPRLLMPTMKQVA